MNARSRLRYFAYGSNMLLERLAGRTPSARFVATARLDGHRLTFHKHGMDGSAKCDATREDAAGAHVLGVLFEIDHREEAALDLAEGLGRGYAKHRVTVTCAPGTAVRAMTYLATALNPALRPFHWYKAYVLAGARQHGLPADYVARIEAVESVDDPDARRRAAQERALAAAGVASGRR